MRSLLIPLALAVLQPALADTAPCNDPNTAGGVICLEGPVHDGTDGPLLAGQVYHIQNDAVVPAGTTLTVQPGAIVKVVPATTFIVLGTLSASGCVFTTVEDDLEGGDTNGDGAASQGDPGDWVGLRFKEDSDASALFDVRVKFAAIGVSLLNSDIALDDCEITDCNAEGLHLLSTSRPLVTGCTFDRNRRPVCGVPAMALPGFSSNSAAANVESDLLLIEEGTLDADLFIGADSSLNGTGTFECDATPAGLVVPPGTTLEFQTGTILKFGGKNFILQSIDVSGTLLANGLGLTSWFDDDLGGDTNKDGAATLPDKGDWGMIQLKAGSDASVLRSVACRYGGNGPATLDCKQTTAVLDQVLVEFSAGAALNLNSTAFPLVTNCVLKDSDGPAVQGVAFSAIDGFEGCSAAGNAMGDHMRADGPVETLTANMLLDVDNTFDQTGVISLETAVTVGPGVALDLGPGLILKGDQSGSLSTQGTLLALSGAVFTSIADDSHGGDTNLGGSGPAPGDWGGLTFHPGSDASLLSDVLVRFAGGPVGAGVRVEDATPTFVDTTIELAAGPGIDLVGVGRPTVSGGQLLANGGAAVNGVHIAAVAGFTDTVAANNVGGDRMRITVALVTVEDSPVSIGPENALGDATFDVVPSMIVAGGAQLVVGGGTTVRMAPGTTATVHGTLTAGSEGAVTVFTSSSNDPQPGDWGGLSLTNGSDASVLEGVEVRFGGSLGSSVTLQFSSATLSNCTVRNGAGDAVDLFGNSFPVINGCHFQDVGGRAIDRVPVMALPGFAGNTAQACLGGDYARVTQGTLGGDLLVRRSQSPNQGPIVVATDLVVFGSDTLTIDPGVIVKWEGFRKLDVSGTGGLEVFASEAAPTIFTSIHDDVVGGDTNKNGNATIPAPGDWNQVDVAGADNSVVRGAVFRYGGGGTLGCLALSFSEMKLLDCVVELANGDAVDLSRTSRPEIRGCRFDQNTGRAVDRAPLEALQNFFGNTASGNLGLDAIRIDGLVTLDEPARVARCNTLNEDGVVVVDASITVQSSGTLTLDPGVVLKFTGPGRSLTNTGVLNIEGAGHDPVVFTVLTDDEVVGDTNKDGAATQPSPGDWRGVQYTFNTGPSVARHGLVRYGGDADVPGIDLLSPNLEAEALRAERCAADGFRISSLASDGDNFVAHANRGNGASLTGGGFDLRFFTSAGNDEIGIDKGANHTGTLTSSIARGNGIDEIAGYQPGEVRFSNVGPAFAGADGNIDADPEFVDDTTGDLRLGPASPCLGVAEVLAADQVVSDHQERSRRLDDDLSGGALPDMGAFERSTWELEVEGTICAGETIGLKVTGPGGITTITLGAIAAGTFVDPFGFDRLTAPARPLAIDVPVGTVVPVRLPDRALLFPALAVQARVNPNGDPSVGQLTQPVRLRYPAPPPPPGIGPQ